MKEEFRDIAPYDDSDFKSYLARLVKEPGLENAISYIMPGADRKQLTDLLLSLNSKAEFQQKVMLTILSLIEQKTTSGVTERGMDRLSPDRNVLFITNHRDIVLDASFLGLALIRHGLPAQAVALGDNLLIYDWIEDLVRLNKGIIVKRNLRLTKALEAARQLSGYIHYCIAEKHESVWIAQREGRAKDSNDVTQESVIKMLALSGPGDTLAARLLPLNITPTAISYEYDPNDYLKASEFLQRRRDPEFKKSQRDDLKSMETGILNFKGRVHFSVGSDINAELAAMLDVTDKVEAVRRICAVIDRQIHLGYRIYPNNYIAYDRLEGSDRFASEYSREDVEHFDAYLQGQLDKVEVADVTAEERGLMLRDMLEMYANPLRNQLIAKGEQAR